MARRAAKLAMNDLGRWLKPFLDAASWTDEPSHHANQYNPYFLACESLNGIHIRLGMGYVGASP